MAISDIMGQYLQTRVDSAVQPFSDPEGYLRQRLLDEEEERKKREREEAAKKMAEDQAIQQKAVEEAQQAQQQPGAMPTAPVAPGQSVAQIPSGMANPNQYGSAIAQGQTSEGPAPTQGGPVAPEQANIEEQRRLQQAQQAQQEQAQQTPAAPAQPGQAAPVMTMEERKAAAAQRFQERAAAASGGQPQVVQQPAPAIPAEAANAAPVMPQLPQAGPGVQVASTEPGSGVAEAAQAQQKAQMPASSVGSLQQVAQQQATIPPVRDYVDAVSDIYNDPAKLMAYSKDGANPREGRLMAAKLLKQQVKSETDKQEAEDALQKAQETGDTTFLDRALRKKSEEGSYLKAILYARLGLNKLAEDEQQKLGAGAKWQAVVGPNSERALIEYDAQGLPRSGMDVNGRELSTKQLAMFGANAMPTKSHLLPSSHGAPVVKEINGVQIGGIRMYDPQTRESYVQVGNKRMPDENWVTTGQAPTAVYNAAGAKKQGEQAAETGQTQTALPARTPEQEAVAQRAEGDIAGLDREITQLNRLPASDPTKQTRIATLNQERAQAQQRLQQAGGPTGAAATVSGTGGIGAGGVVTQRPGESYAAYKQRAALAQSSAEAAAKANIELGKEERSNFLTYEEKEIVPKADAGGSIASTRKSQLKGPDGILSNPEIVGMMQGQGGTAAEVGNIIRDLVTGEKDSEELSRRVAALGLTQRQKDVLYNQIGLNRQIAPKTLKENAGAGSVSDAEQKANREAAVDITRVPLYTAVTLLSKDQFDKDQQVARAAFRQSNPGLTTVRAFNDAWGKEKSKLDAEYNQIYAARAQYIKKYYNDGQNPGAIVDAYKHYPVPEFNRQTGRWDYGTDYARKAARPKLSSFER